MNARQRRLFAAWKHSRLPLGSAVIVRGVKRGKVWKHDSQRPNTCIVHYHDDNGAYVGYEWVPLAQVQPVKRVKVKPWYRRLWGRVRQMGVAA